MSRKSAAKKTDRLLKDAEFRSVFDAAHQSDSSRGRILRAHPYYVIYWKAPFEKSATSTNAVFRYGLSIAKQVVRGSVERNRIRRCMREYFRLSATELPSGDAIVRVVKKPDPMTFGAITDPLKKKFEELKEMAKN